MKQFLKTMLQRIISSAWSNARGQTWRTLSSEKRHFETTIVTDNAPTSYKFVCVFFPAVALRPNAGHGLLILEVLDHTQQRNTVGRTPLDE
jgi:hypothetical protein